ncbi:Gfo/Idh/MocA family oxidoreductase [Olivibacter sp. SDN3]|uniref:Gfo/Idh/MocA family oxidoreductase n=1 Tax=Olivibacter sp. SDN3 TaxID=2764720 RepID=UPI0016514B07|nr:Gfo/Idh/MocA family oxidoreductase [Olivibacter sp. SDN3]QNL50929.1 Gfo/Idh/MocA family oxidoreductase [Olivibacter sp. SDN3]
MQKIKTALLSYGMSGSVFHAPFVDLHPNFDLAGAWERSKKLIQKDYPEVTSYPSLESVLEDESIVLVVVNTPTGTHYEFTKKVLEAGKHAVVEKAFTITAAEAQELAILAGSKGLKLAVFQNRRWDSDFKTVKKVVESDMLGEIVEATFSYEAYLPKLNTKAHLEEPSPAAGLIRDRGPHMIDQALCIFGYPNAVFADLGIMRTDSRVNDYFELILYYSDKRVRLKGGFLAREMAPSYIVHGKKGSFLKSRADQQENRLLAGEKPNNSDWCEEPESERGILHAERKGEAFKELVPTEKGNYIDFYEGVFRAITDDKPEPVTPDEGVQTMKIIEAAIASDEQKAVIELA